MKPREVKLIEQGDTARLLYSHIRNIHSESLERSFVVHVQQCILYKREVSKDRVKERERGRNSKLILIASLTVSVGFSTLSSTLYKGKSGGEVRKRHSILIYCPTTVLLTTLSTTLLSVGRFKS